MDWNKPRAFEVVAAGTLMVTLAGCSGAEQTVQPTAAPTNTSVAVVTAEAPVIPESPVDPVEATSEPVETTEEETVEDEYVAAPTKLEDTPWGQKGLDHPWEMSKRQWNGMLDDAYDYEGKKSFCDAVNNADGTPGENLVLGIILTDVEIYIDDPEMVNAAASHEEFLKMRDWSNDFFADRCGWYPASAGVEDAEQEREANAGIAESYGPDTVGNWNKGAVVSAMDAADQGTKDAVCAQLTSMEGGDWSVFYGDEYSTWTPENQQQAGLWLVDWALNNCDF